MSLTSRRSLLAAAAAGAALYSVRPCLAQSTWSVNAMLSDMDCGNTCDYDSGPEITSWLATNTETTCNLTTQYNEVLANLGTCVSCTSDAVTAKGPGYFCTGNEVKLCPVGFYCPDYITKLECPEGQWCKAGFVEPIDCSPMVTCAAGAEQIQVGPGFLLMFIFMIALFCTCSCCLACRRHCAEVKMKEAARRINDTEEIDLGTQMKMDVPKLEIEFKNLSMHLKSNGKCVLDRVTGKFPPESLVALMGPSGGGKTTFMNALCGRSSYGNVSGDIFINGKAGGVTDFPKMTGFVPQDDIMFADLTVHQNIYYNAKLRLPADTPDKMVVDHANNVVHTLGMDKIAHNLVGNAAKRGISGGQKKRVNIGMELAAMPSVIFMDEPTSGLDGAATVQLAKCLDRLRKSGIMIVCVIHQPRLAVFSQFSHLLLLGNGGGEVYCGTTSGLEPYFTSLGFRMAERENVADWMIDVVCGLVPKHKGPKTDELDIDFVAPKGLYAIWEEKYKGRPTPYDGVAIAHDEPIHKDRATPGFCRQTMLFMSREARRFDFPNLMISCAILFATGAIFGTLVRGNLDFTYPNLMTQLSSSSILYYMICTINARNIFGFERLEYMREFMSGTSSAAYWTSKMVVHLVPWFMYGFSYSLTFYWFQPVPAQGFGQFMLTYLMAGWYHMGLGIMLSVAFPNPTTSLLCSVFAPMALDIAFSGGLILIKDMGVEIIFAVMTCGRWHKPLLFVQELRRYPEHTRDFKDVQNILDNYVFDFGDEGKAVLALFLMGCVMRVWTLMNLSLLKYSEGNSCLGRLRALISKWLDHAGFGSINKPKEDDIVEHGQVYERRPSNISSA